MPLEPFQLTRKPGEPAYVTIERWEREHPGISAGMTTRIGGVSGAPYETLNCALHIQDEPVDVIENRRRLGETLGWPFEAWTCGEQVHDRQVAVVTPADKGKGRESREDAFANTDAIVTNEPGIWLTSFYADCVPLYFFDPVRQAVGLAHAGWKGTVLRIAGETIRTMSEAYGTDPSDVMAAIGPSIGMCCYEVDDTVIARIDSCLDEIGAEPGVRSCVYRPGAENGKWMLSLQEMNRQIMIKAGILPTHIEICGMCTGCRTDLFFSHRKENGATGRMASWIGLRSASQR